MPSFTLTLLESANVTITVGLVEDSVKRGLFHVYITSLKWKTYLAQTAGREYRLELNTQYKTSGAVSPYYVAPADSYLTGTDAAAFTLNETINLTGTPAGTNFLSLLSSSGATFTGVTLAARSYIGSYRGSSAAIVVPTLFTLKERISPSPTWNDISETGVETPTYDFAWDGNGTLTPAQNYQLKIVLDTNTANHPSLPILYYATGISPVPTGTVTVGFHTYTPVADPGGKVVGAGIDFALHLPRDDDAGAGVTAAVDDFDTTTIPARLYNLFDFGLQQTAFGSAPTYTGYNIDTNTNVTPYSKATLRNTEQNYFANIDWLEVWVKSIVYNDGFSDISVNVNYGSFTLYSLLVTLSAHSATSARYKLNTDLATTTSIILKEINITPYIAVADRAGSAPVLP